MGSHRSSDTNSNQGRPRRGRSLRGSGGNGANGNQVPRDHQRQQMSDFPDDEPFEDELDDDDPDAERMNVMMPLARSTKR